MIVQYALNDVMYNQLKHHEVVQHDVGKKKPQTRVLA